MDRVVKVLGLGAKSSLDLDRSHYVAGDVLLGSVVLRVVEPLDFLSLVLHIRGKELLTWSEGGGQTASIYVREYLHLDEEVVLSTEHQSYQPGEFHFQLHTALSNSFHISNRNAGLMRRIDASLRYWATAVMTMKGKFSTKMEAKKLFMMQQPPLGQPVCSLSNSATADITMLRMMKKGVCSVAAQLPSNVHIAGDIVVAQTKVHNDTLKDMKKLSMMLYEDICIDLDTSKQKAEGSQCVCCRDFPGIKARKTSEQALDLPLVTETSPAGPVSTVIQSHFLTTKHRLVIKCKFRLCQSVSLDFPIEILQKVPIGATYVPTAAVMPALAAPVASSSNPDAAVMPVAAVPERIMACVRRSQRSATSLKTSARSSPRTRGERAYPTS